MDVTLAKTSAIFKLAFESSDFRKLDTIEKYRKKHQDKIEKTRDMVRDSTYPIGEESWSGHRARVDQLADVLTSEQLAKLRVLSVQKQKIIESILAEGHSNDEFSGSLSEMDELAEASRGDYNIGALSGIAGTASGVGAYYSYPKKLRTLLLGLGALGGIGYGIHRFGKGGRKSDSASAIHKDFFAKARRRAMGKEAGVAGAVVSAAKKIIEKVRPVGRKVLKAVKGKASPATKLLTEGKTSPATKLLTEGKKSTTALAVRDPKNVGIMEKIKLKLKGNPKVMGEKGSKVNFRRKNILIKSDMIKDKHVSPRATKGGVQALYNRNIGSAKGQFDRKTNIAKAHSGKWKYQSNDGKFHRTLGGLLSHPN